VGESIGTGANIFVTFFRSVKLRLPFVFACLILLLPFVLFAQSNFEDRNITDITVDFSRAGGDVSESDTYVSIARDAVGSTYSTTRIRDAIEKLYNTKQIATISVEATPTGANGVSLRFLIRRKIRAQKVNVEVIGGEEAKVTEQELLLKLNLLESGTALTDQTLQQNADVIQEYLRDRGFFKAQVGPSPLPLPDEPNVTVIFNVTPGPQATVEKFDVNIEGFDNAKIVSELKLQPGEKFSRALLNADVEKIKQVLRDNDFLAPVVSEPRTVYDTEKNTMSITVTGSKGPEVEVIVEAEADKPGGRTQDKLIPVKREGTLDYAAIVEGERRLENYFQEHGYFFVNVTPACSVEPPLTDANAASVKNDTEFLCSALSSSDLTNHKVTVKYNVNLDRKLKLVDIRLRGTDQFTMEEIQGVLESQEANILGFVPIFGYGRGLTSQRLLEQDANTIRSLLRELGYRDATVRVNQGVTPEGDHLIITFVVEQGDATKISGVDITGNNAFTDQELIKRVPEITTLNGQNFSRAKVRNVQRKLAEIYSQEGYYDAKVDFSIDQDTENKLFKVTFNVQNEGEKVYINRILVTGNDKTRPTAVLRALAMEPGELLKAGDVYKSEQTLYGSDAFSNVEIRPQSAGKKADGTGRLTDIIVNVQEQPSRIFSYGGGFSTDLGLSGFADLRHLNLLGRLWQGGARIRMSQRQQLAQIDFVNPRFIRDGKKRYAPLTISASYQRDSTVTRFFRSAFDRGTFGIVQRIDADGNPIDTFGQPAGSPTINRLTLSAETNRTISVKDRSVLFVRYRFEDVRVYNINSLLIRDLLEPDSRIRISGFGVTFARDTRKNCNIKYSILEIIARGETGPGCKYNASDPTNGDYFTAEYNVSLPVLGANVGFNKFQASYNAYYTLPFLQHSKFKPLRNTTFAARAVLGVANVFTNRNRFDSVGLPELNGILPVSERFFAGGSNTLRGFDFEEAGPRVVIVPVGQFRNSQGDAVFLDPFTVPFGGNALAVVNLEARIPLTKSIRAVPFYDGGNVFRRVGDIFNPPDVPPGNVTQQNLRALWSHTIGLGFRLKTPIGGEFGIDYGYLLNPPRFIIPQVVPPNAIYQLPQSQIHFRFSQAF
jgi:outer membrane protein insertion porin family